MTRRGRLMRGLKLCRMKGWKEEIDAAKSFVENYMIIGNFNEIELIRGCCERCSFLLVMLLGVGGCDGLNWKKRWEQINLKKTTEKQKKKTENQSRKNG
jgi:hypothetical protein